jgi:disulfide bond formation protein DsbB
LTTTNPHPAASETRASGGIDPRGPQLTAAITAVVLVVVLLLPTPWAAVLTGVQAVLFAVGAFQGVQHTPHAWLFRTFVRPRLSPPAELEDPAPPRFAQGVGLAFTLVALVAFLVGQSTTGVPLLGQVAIGLALVAALLNAAFRLCLGCEMYLLIKRSTTAH